MNPNDNHDRFINDYSNIIFGSSENTDVEVHQFDFDLGAGSSQNVPSIYGSSTEITAPNTATTSSTATTAPNTATTSSTATTAPNTATTSSTATIPNTATIPSDATIQNAATIPNTATIPRAATIQNAAMISNTATPSAQIPGTRRVGCGTTADPALPQPHSVSIPCARETETTVITSQFKNLFRLLNHAKYLGSTGLCRRDKPCYWMVNFQFNPIINSYEDIVVTQLIHDLFNKYLANGFVCEVGKSSFKNKVCWAVLMQRNCDVTENHFRIIRQGTVKSVATRPNYLIIRFHVNRSFISYLRFASNNQSETGFIDIIKFLSERKFAFNSQLAIGNECWEIGREVFTNGCKIKRSWMQAGVFTIFRKDYDSRTITHLIAANVKDFDFQRMVPNFLFVENLNLSNTAIISLRNFPILPNLKKLNISRNKIENELDYLCNCTKIESLDVSFNKIQELSTLEILKNLLELKHLHLEGNEVVTRFKNYRCDVLKLIPQLICLDNIQAFESEDEDDEDEEMNEDDLTDTEEYTEEDDEIDEEFEKTAVF